MNVIAMLLMQFGLACAIVLLRYNTPQRFVDYILFAIVVCGAIGCFLGLTRGLIDYYATTVADTLTCTTDGSESPETSPVTTPSQ